MAFPTMIWSLYSGCLETGQVVVGSTAGMNRKKWVGMGIQGMAKLLACLQGVKPSRDLRTFGVEILLLGIGLIACASAAAAQSSKPTAGKDSTSAYQQTTDDLNHRLADIDRKIEDGSVSLSSDYRIGPDDQLDIMVLEAPDLNRSPRVSASGEVSLALVGSVRAAGLTTRELEIVIEELYRRSYILDPHVSVQVRDMQSHSVAVFGAVKKPGVFQIREPKTVVELLSLAEGLDNDAGDSVIIERRGVRGSALPLSDNNQIPAIANSSQDPSGHSVPEIQKHATDSPATLTEANEAQPSVDRVDLKKLLDTGDPTLNLMVYPGDVVKVPRAELVYVVGEVGRPGGFELKSNENISVLQAIALAQGMTHTSAGARARIIRADSETGQRQEIPINLSKIIAGKLPDPILRPRDIVFVPNSLGRTAALRSLDMVATIGSGIAVYRW